MGRRHFLKYLLNGFKSLVLMNMAPLTAACGGGKGLEGSGRHFADLNGMTIKEMAGLKIHHGPDGVFLNPLGELRRRRRLGRVLYWKLFSENRFSQYLKDQPVRPVSVDWDTVKNHNSLSVTFLKHASVLIKDNDRTILVDPVFDDIFWFIKDHTPLAFDPGQMPKPDHILITHGHYDHLDVPSLRRMDKTTHVISPLGYDDIFHELKMDNRTRLDWFQTFSQAGRRFTLLPCNHWTMRNPIRGPNRSLWGSYLIETASGHTLYLSGDTAWFEGFEEIGRSYEIDLAIINLGAYEPRWFMAPSHMNPAETVAAFRQLNAKKLMIVHWGTFRLGDEPVHFPPMDLKAELEKEGLLDRWVNLRHGETYFV